MHLLYSLLADGVMLVHLAFVLFVILGALLVLRKRWIAWFHVPSALYGAAIEFFGWICPLTPLEQELRRRAGQGGYHGGFIEHYVGQILYPSNWRQIHVLLGVVVILLNTGIYAWILTRGAGGATEEAASPGADAGASPSRDGDASTGAAGSR